MSEFDFKPDEIGRWSEDKLEILEKYFAAYSKILSKYHFKYSYIDAFSGAGVHVSKETGEIISGSPLRALKIRPPFHEYHFIDIDNLKLTHLQNAACDNPGVFCHEGNCNEILLKEVLPNIRYDRYERAICLFDPYGLHLNWEVIEYAGNSKAMEIFLNFPIADMNRNVLWENHEGVSEDQKLRMNKFWGNDSWKNAAYEVTPGLFDDIIEKTNNKAVADAFKKRLKAVAGFKYVAEPVPMKNSRNAIVYYLFFASQNEKGCKIANDIFNTYRK
ncbi:MAG: hypothetical protein CVV44_20165 [Spirochaetae bacterium HGW-Spirochaetae-1]|jgi:three-Cys-motif partner protein|nr:MAG: hypothetical protein CVV44_20165 [Spirochaetae bacterium HGW-Spirochaetae-1]